jgi:hypothetical protein
MRYVAISRVIDRCANADHDQVEAAVRDLGLGLNSTGGVLGCEGLREARFVKRNAAADQCCPTVIVTLDEHDVVTTFCQAHRRRDSYISGANHSGSRSFAHGT